MIIAVINQKGGGGKTTTTLNLGATLAREEQRVLLADLDLQRDLMAYEAAFEESDKHRTFPLPRPTQGLCLFCSMRRATTTSCSTAPRVWAMKL